MLLLKIIHFSPTGFQALSVSSCRHELFHGTSKESLSSVPIRREATGCLSVMYNTWCSLVVHFLLSVVNSAVGGSVHLSIL